MINFLLAESKKKKFSTCRVLVCFPEDFVYIVIIVCCICAVHDCIYRKEMGPGNAHNALDHLPFSSQRVIWSCVSQEFPL